jgi:sporulation protein YlmC with PRC-barrel domain
MKSKFALLAATLTLAGCSCAEPDMRVHTAQLRGAECRPAATAQAVPESRQPKESWQIGKLLKTRVRDREGKDVAQIEDLRLTPDGRISSVTVSVDGRADGERMVTIPFRELKRSEAPGGEYVVQTSFNLKPPEPKEPEKRERGGSGDGKPEASGPKTGKTPEK